jgi:hypothetical protein
MNASTTEDNYPESTLSSSDLKGLLRAASLAEFRPDDVKGVTEDRFEKSNSLFDLVRSGLSDGDVSDDPVDQKGLQNVVKVQGDSKVLSDQQPDKDQGKQSNENFMPVDEGLLSESEYTGTANSEANLNPAGSADSADSNTNDQGVTEHGDSYGSVSVEDSFEHVALVDDADNSPTEALPIVESVEFQEEMQKLKLELERQLADEKQVFAKTIEVLIGASNFILEDMENQISDFVLSVASDLAGSKIDKLPTPFAKKITRVANQIVGNEDEVTIHLNTEDFKVINSTNIGTDIKYKFLEKPALKRAEFEVSGRKSSAGITLFDLIKGN